MGRWSILLNVIGSIVILASNEFKFKIVGIIILILSGMISKKKTVIRRIR